MATEYGVVLAALMGAAAALTGGVLAQRYQYLLERRKEHFQVLRDNVLVPWSRAIGARQANLEGRDPYVVIDYVAKDYRSSPGMSFAGGTDQVPWTESSGLAEASRGHWPRLWSEWSALNSELGALGQKVITALRKVEAAFPPLPPGKAWAHYAEEPAMAVRLAVVNAWASHSQVFERRTYPDWVVTQLTQFGFWRDDGDLEAKRAYARKVVALFDGQPEVAALEAAAAQLSERFQQFGRRLEDTVQGESFPGRCGYCPRFLR